MAIHQLERVHGHTIKELEHLLQDTCDLFDSNMYLDHETLGGWSNINIRGHSENVDFVLKLPWSISLSGPTPYKRLYDISLYFNKLNMAALPLSMGRLSDVQETPFIIFEYVKGVIRDSVADTSSEEFRFLRNRLQFLSQQKPPGLKRYKSASDYLVGIHTPVENHEGLSELSKEVGELVKSFNELYPDVLSYTDSLDMWNQSLMHGDLWVPNIVYQSRNIILLDFEACAYGNWLYDFAYLLETPDSVFNKPPGLLHSEEVDQVDDLRPLATAFVISWSLDRLLSMDAGLVEPNLDTAEIRSAILDYTRSKISRLESIMP